MIIWEHASARLVFNHDATKLLADFDDVAAARGRDGWEVVSVVPAAGTRDLLVFFRRVSPNPIALVEELPPAPVATPSSPLAPTAKCQMCKGAKTVGGGKVPCPLCSESARV